MLYRRDLADLLDTLACLAEQQQHQDATIVCGDGRLATSRLLLTLGLPLVQGLLEGEEVVLLLPHHSVLDIRKKLRAFLSGRWTAKYEVIQVRDDYQPSLQGDKEMTSDEDLDTTSKGSIDDDQSFEEELVLDKNYEDTTEISVKNNFDDGVPIKVNVGDEQTFVKELFDPENDSPKEEPEQTFVEMMIPIKIEEKEQTPFETITATNGLGKAIIKEENENKDKELFFDKESSTWNCKLCGKKSSQKNLANLRKHVKYGHSDEARYSCPCGITFKWPAALRRHVNKKHEISSFEYQTICKHACLCGVRFIEMQSLKQHVHKDHGKGSEESKHFETSVETTKTYNKEGTKKVVEVIPKPRFYDGIYDDLPREYRYPVHFLEKPEVENKCRFCEEKFDDFFKLVEHKKRYVDGNEWVCPEEGCTTRYSGTNNSRPLDSHLKGHRGELDFTCEKCGKKVPSQFILSQHMKIHAVSLELRCELCPKRMFKTEPLLREHMKHIHENPIKIGCEICGRLFWKHHKIRLRNHINSHEGKRSYQCSFCPKQYYTSTALWKHKKWTHNIGEKKWYKCSYCAKDFQSNCKLEEHEKIHTGDKAFECSKCGKQFVQKANLKTHNKKCEPSS